MFSAQHSLLAHQEKPQVLGSSAVSIQLSAEPGVYILELASDSEAYYQKISVKK